LTQVDVAERRVAVVAGAIEHDVVAVYFSRKENAVAVEGEKRVLKLYKGFEIFCLGNADCRSAGIVAPQNVVRPIDLQKARIVPVQNRCGGRAVFILERDDLVLDIPMNSFLYGMMALLKTRLESLIGFLSITGFLSYLQTTSVYPFGFFCHGILGNALPTIVFFMVRSYADRENVT
jgi:hypothetical protein